jgi:tetratricopeptide (TPR) repeat protein
VELDPAFALGWYRLALAASFSLDHVLAREASEEALNHVERLPGRQRRLLEAFQAFLRGDANQAEELYRSILHRHPDDLESWYLLGETLFHYNRRRGRSTAEAREAFERVLELDPGHHSALFHLISVAARQDDLDAVDSLAKRFNESFRGHRLCSWAQALQAFALDDLAAQERVLADERLQRESVVIFEQVALDTYNIPGLRRFLQPYLSPDLPPLLRSHAKRLLAPLSLAEGKWSQARSELAESEALGSVTVVAYRAYLTSAAFLELPREELEQAREAVLSLHNDPRISGSEVEAMGLHIWPYLPALLSARLGDTDTVLQHAAELEKVADPPEMGTLSKDLAFGLRARVASIDGQAAEALAWLEQARNEIAWVATTLPFASLGSERFLRAELLDELGRSEEALRWYASVADSVLDLVLLAPAHYRSGEICERLGRREEAVYHYSRVAEMWQDCDPELRSVLEGARERLKSLGAS